jgi:hypothetical protein
VLSRSDKAVVLLNSEGFFACSDNSSLGFSSSLVSSEKKEANIKLFDTQHLYRYISTGRLT